MGWSPTEERLAIRFVDDNDAVADLVGRHSKRKKRHQQLEDKQRLEETLLLVPEYSSYWQKKWASFEKSTRPYRIRWHAWRLAIVREYIKDFTVDQIRIKAQMKSALYLKKDHQFTQVDEREVAQVLDKVVGTTPSRVYVLAVTDPLQTKGLRTLGYFA